MSNDFKNFSASSESPALDASAEEWVRQRTAGAY